MWNVFEDSPVAREYGQVLTGEYQYKEEALEAIRQYIADQNGGIAEEVVLDQENATTYWLDDQTKFHIF